MKTKPFFLVCLAAFASAFTVGAARSQLLGWNNLGMHCMDSDYSVFSVLPPYNTIEAQLIVAGRLVTNGAGYTVTYQAVADPDGSFNSTAMGKGLRPVPGLTRNGRSECGRYESTSSSSPE